jgi:hypothetical protein
LYLKGNGVAIDSTEAQSWRAKAQSCQGGNLALMQQQIAQFRARAAAARDPMLAAIPVVPKSAPVAAGNGNGPGFSVNPKVFAGLVVGAVIVAALVALTPSSKNGPALLCVRHGSRLERPL